MVASTNRVLFLHVRKTAGTSARIALKSIFDLQNECCIRSQLELSGKVKRSDWSTYLNGYDFVAGHFDNIAHVLSQEFKTVIFLRDPIDRVISAYNHIQNDTNDPLHRYAVGRPLIECLFMPELRKEMSNSQARYLIGNSGHDYDTLDDEMRYEVAIKYLQSVDFVGLTEFIELSLALISKSTGKEPMLEVPKANQAITSVGPKRMDMVECHEKIIQQNLLDTKIYSAAKKLFSERLMDQLFASTDTVVSVNPSLNTRPLELDSAAEVLDRIETTTAVRSVLKLALSQLAVNSQPDIARYHYRYAAALRDNGFERQAQRASRSAYELNPSQSLFRFRYLIDLIKSSNHDEAVVLIARHRSDFSFEQRGIILRTASLSKAPPSVFAACVPVLFVRYSSEQKPSTRCLHFEKRSGENHLRVLVPKNFSKSELMWRRVAILEALFDRMMRVENTDLTTSFLLDLSDGVANPWGVVSFCSSDSTNILIPDPSFFRTEGYKGLKEKSLANPIEFSERHAVAYWRGAVTGTPPTPSTNDGFSDDTQIPRIRLCVEALHCANIDAKISHLGNRAGDEALKAKLQLLGVWGDTEPVERNLKYKYLVDIDGNTNSWPGLISKLICGGVVIKIIGHNRFNQWYYDKLKHGDNIFYAKTMDEVQALVTDLEKDPIRAYRVAKNGQKLAMNLSMENMLEQTARLLLSLNARDRAIP